MEGVYELIMHQDGLLTSDWEARHIVEMEEDEDDVIMRIRMMGKKKPELKKVDNTEEINRIQQMERDVELVEEVRRQRRTIQNLENENIPNYGSSCGGNIFSRGR